MASLLTAGLPATSAGKVFLLPPILTSPDDWLLNLSLNYLAKVLFLSNPNKNIKGTDLGRLQLLLLVLLLLLSFHFTNHFLSETNQGET